MTTQGRIPHHICDLFENSAASELGSRAHQTKVINKLFTKQKNGRWQLNVTDPMFEEHRSTYEKKFGKDEHKALPKSIIKGLYFHNDEAAFQAAVSSGEVRRTTDGDGHEFWSFRQLKAGTEKSSTHNQETRGLKHIDVQSYQKLNEAMDGLGWGLTFSKKD